MTSLLVREDFTNIQKAQAGLTRLLEKGRREGKYFRVMKNDQPLGVLVPNEMWLSIVEDLEALSSPSFKASVSAARKAKKMSLSETKKQLGI
jgi:hypothetical protein